ncbi:hypothetical protein TraAM80_03582 [Trypanosoma rangeli]|uniref:Uncharacterized protein n=1 Tax=Trypanosoma rangeli TaxID=5698 RepID=A0A3R7M120_TRYRA|nr:uncharacterized protein TraAM80_03582 [Trypanosoma rangeli]RNF07095.1 hypothetical protein TraAM80_03582 [Trypanosoma rangeli]|eukprot:RNF07095.1 hypothetical protein TraAM80_03582 [Trypanosoma rangeli]
MAVHLTPLKRSQLLDLGRLLESVLRSSCSSPLGSSLGVLSGDNSAVSNAHAGVSGHPFACGAFCDVFEDPSTRHAWRLYDKMLYLVWWSYRPPCCTECGMRDAWVPSADSEMKCWHCGSGAGTSFVKDIVEDIPALENEDGDEDGDSDGGDVAGEDGAMATGGGAGGGGPVASYMFFYEWLSRMQLMERGREVVLPTGENLAAVLRAAYDLALLFVVPGLPSTGAAVLQGGALYLSLVLHRFPAPFPLFRLAGRGNVANQPQGGPAATTLLELAGEEQRGELQWVDVELLGALIGVSLSDFFESSQVAVQYLQNVMTVAAAFAVPSVLWHPQRVESRAEYMMALRDKRSCATPLHSTAVSSGLSPEHTAMIVALELARAFDTEPCSSVEHCERIGAWLDRHGLYPQRQAYQTRSRSKQDNSNDNNNNNSHAPQHCHSAQPSLVNGGASDKPHATRAVAATEDTAWWVSPITTDVSPFAGSMQVVLLSPCANALLYVFARAFSMSALELADMAVSSGLYHGPTRFFDTLRQAAQSGNYTVMPLFRRLSPVTSVWTSAYFALHSEDRLPLLAALQHIRAATTREKELPVARVVQRILRKHQASRQYQFNYSIRVTDDSEKQPFKGVYFLSFLTERFAVYTGVRSARKTVTFDAATGKITLCVIGAKEQQVESLHVEFNGPIIAHIETESAKCVIDCVRQSLSAESWQVTVRHLDRCGRVRRRMRVPMLASRLDALASVREATAMASHPIASNTTLLGWGETEVLFTSLPYANNVAYAVGLRRELQLNLLSLPKPSLVFGISENRVIAMYASLVALLEGIEQRLSQPSSAGATTTWVDVLLSEEEEWELEAVHAGGRLRPRDPPLSHANISNAAPESFLLPPASTAVVEQQQQQQQNGTSKQISSRSREMRSVPTYQEVLLGLTRPQRGGGGRVVPGCRVRPTPHRERQQRRVIQQPQQSQRFRGDAGDGVCHGTAAASTSRGCSSFNLFSAEECRRRLYRLLEFIAVYVAQRQKCEGSNAVVHTEAATGMGSGEASVTARPVDAVAGVRREPASPRPSHTPQQPSTPREKPMSRHNTSPSLNGTTPSLKPKPPLHHGPPSAAKPLSSSPLVEASQPHRHQRRQRRSRSEAGEGSEDTDQDGRSPLASAAVQGSGTIDRALCPRKRSRPRNEETGLQPPPPPRSTSPSASSSHSGLDGSSSRTEGSSDRRPQPRRRRRRQRYM